MEQIRLDLIPNGIMPNVHASQFDKSRTVRFNLCEGDTPFTLLATDNVKVTCNGVEDSTLATAGTSHDWTIPDFVVADSGIFIGELSVERGSKTIGSKNFVLNVEEDAYNGKNIEERTASGSIANFETNLQDNLTACKCTINPLQSGTGTPSPSNPRPISGFSGANIVVADENMIAQSTTNIPFGQTVYGGVLDVTNGKLTITHGIVDLGTLDWINEDSALSGLARVNTVQVAPLGAKYLQIPICTQYEGVYSKGFNVFNNGEIAFSNSEALPMLRARSTEFVGKTNAEIKALMSGVMLCYELATPTEITLTPKQIETLVGINNVYHDCNGQTEVKYLVEV